MENFENKLIVLEKNFEKYSEVSLKITAFNQSLKILRAPY